MMKKIKEVVVVEGKDDTKQIKKAVDADTIETRGSAISEETIELISKLQQTRGVIVFTDPDFNGEKIRKIISSEVPGVKHAFLKRSEAEPKGKGSLGIEHAQPEAIKNALSKVYTEGSADYEVISRDELVNAGLIGIPEAKERRQELGEILNLGYVNAKQLQKRLNMFGISREEFEKAVRKMNGSMK